MPMLPITLENITNAVHEGFKAGINASDAIMNSNRPRIDCTDGEFLLRKERDVTSKVLEQITRKLEYRQDPDEDTVYWAVRDGALVYYDTMFGMIDNPPVDLAKWNDPTSFSITPAKVAMWAELLGIIEITT